MKSIKIANSCKFVEQFKIDYDCVFTHLPEAGDVAIFEVLELNSTDAIQNAEGRNCYLFEGDHVMLAFGNRYASNQFEAYLPRHFQQEYDLVSKGGVAGNVASMHFKLEELGPTKLKLIGFATEHNGVINTRYYHRKKVNFNAYAPRPYQTILSLGSSMDSGKTTTAAHLCRGLKNAGNQVAYIKLTGTIFNKDRMLCFDCGADYVSDFSELGFPSTFLCNLEELMDIYEGLLQEVAQINPDYVVIEIADGLYQQETNQLINHQPFTDTIDHVILSCGDSLAVNTGVQLLTPLFNDRLFALGGLFTGSPLLTQEVKQKAALPVLTLEDLASPEVVTYMKGKEQHVLTTAEISKNDLLASESAA